MPNSSELTNLVLQQVWQVTVVALLVGLVSSLGRTRNWHPAVCGTLWSLVLVKAVVPPVWASPIGLFSLAQWTSSAESAAGFQPWSWNATLLPAPAWAGVLAVWLVGLVAVAARRTRAWRDLRQALRTATLPDAAIGSKYAALARQLGVHRVPPLLVTADLGPALVGAWQPAVVLPAHLLQRGDWRELEPVLAHEILHARRHDTRWALVQAAIEAVWWFHPLVRLAARQVVEATERIVDRTVLAETGCDSARYCRALLRVLETQALRSQAWMAAPVIRGAGTTCERMRELASMPARNSASRRIADLTLLLVLGALLLPGKSQYFAVPRCSPSTAVKSVEPQETWSSELPAAATTGSLTLNAARGR